MKHYQYLLIGGGLTGDAAAREIRELDADATIGMLSLEPDPPYVRPNLSKGLWKGKAIEKIWCNTQGLGVDLHLGCKAVKLTPQTKSIHDEQGNEYTYDKLLLATGGTANHLPFGDDKIIYYRGLQDYRRLRLLSDLKDSFLVIGGGFIGSEITAALTLAGKNVSMVFPGATIGDKIYPEELAQFISDYYRQKGVQILAGDTITGIEQSGEKIMVYTQTGRILTVDGVVAGIGIRPNVELAQQAGMHVENGIIVDEYLQTSLPDIYAAGDVANFYHASLGKRVRVEHEDNAVQMGKMAGRNMVGQREAYEHAPMFYSDLFELGYEAVGELSSKLEIITDWQEPFKKGVLYYLEDARVRGVLLWNVWDKVKAARALINEPAPFKATDLVGRL